ncbi:MAG: hypothetical protein QW806_09965 [Nitrososphaerota archaeon]
MLDNNQQNYVSFCSNFKHEYITTKRISNPHLPYNFETDAEIYVLRYDFRVRKICDINILHVISKDKK